MVNCKTQITDVVVYPDRARLTRQGKVKLESGRHTLEVTELPLELIPASLRATGRGTAKARLLGVQAQRFFYAETPAEQVQELEKKLEGQQCRDVIEQDPLLREIFAVLVVHDLGLVLRGHAGEVLPLGLGDAQLLVRAHHLFGELVPLADLVAFRP